MRITRPNAALLVAGAMGFAVTACQSRNEIFSAPSMSVSAIPLPPPPPGEVLPPRAPAASASASPTPAGEAELPKKLDPTNQQTHDLPKSDSPALAQRTALLWNAIVSGEPSGALPAFFPVSAYEQVKAIQFPAADWRRRLVSAFNRDIKALHKQLGENAATAKLLRLEIPAAARWMNPGEEGNKIGYYRVLGSKLWFEAGGREQSFDITSLISWRGEWYFVHLTGFK